MSYFSHDFLQNVVKLIEVFNNASIISCMHKVYLHGIWLLDDITSILVTNFKWLNLWIYTFSGYEMKLYCVSVLTECSNTQGEKDCSWQEI